MAADRTIAIAQALFLRHDDTAVTAVPDAVTDAAEAMQLGRSADFRDEWLPVAQQMIAHFGRRPAGVACPEAVFALPLDKNHVAVVQVADQPGGGLGFYFLAVARDFYAGWLGDPFLLAQRHPALWHLRGELPTLSVAKEPAPPRLVMDLQRILQRVKAHALAEGEDPNFDDEARLLRDSESPALLGGAQLLVDGGKLVLVRPAPDPGFVQALWALLPHTSRGELWPASFAFSTELPFDVVAMPRAEIELPPGRSNEEQAADYPAGKYERDLQAAVESGDQVWLDRLLARRSRRQVWKTALILLVGLGLVVPFLQQGAVPARDPRGRAAGAASIVAVGNPFTAAAMFELADPAWRRR